MVIADTGAMAMVGGTELATGLGVKREELLPVTIDLSAANSSKLSILGGIFLNVWGRCKNGDKVVTRQLCYIQEGDQKIYLSKNACEVLGLISNCFPCVGDCFNEAPVMQKTRRSEQPLYSINISR